MTRPEPTRCETHKNYRGRSRPNQPCLACLCVYYERRANTYEEGDSENVTYDDMLLLIPAIRAEIATVDLQQINQTGALAEQIIGTIADRISYDQEGDPYA